MSRAFSGSPRGEPAAAPGAPPSPVGLAPNPRPIFGWTELQEYMAGMLEAARTLDEPEGPAPRNQMAPTPSISPPDHSDP
eukprot:11117052-Alexandrium_andersonii.AAC.1